MALFPWGEKMKSHEIIKPTNIAAGTVLGLDENQVRRRAHLLESVDVKGLPDGFTGQKLTGRTQFKRGETLWADELPKNLATVAAGSGKAADSKKGSKKSASKSAD